MTDTAVAQSGATLTTGEIVKTLLEAGPGVSDLIFSPGRPAQVEKHGELVAVTVPDMPFLRPEDTSRNASDLIGSNEQALRGLKEQGACDLSYSLADVGRFRVNVFKQRGSHAIVMRVIASRIPSLAELNLPAALVDVAALKNGIVLVTGPTGSGKSSTLAAIIDRINETRAEHILTIEDPIEFLHSHKKGTVHQRELHSDTPTFSAALRAALRQAPKVILVGEMRDRETAELALKASETGHLVLSTLHTVNAGQAINRVIGMFDKDEEKQIRQRLADTLRWVVGQRLVPKVGGGRWAVHDILANTIRSNELILLGESDGKTFYEIQEVGEPFGMMTFDQSLLHSYEHGLVTEDTAVNYSTRKAVVQRGIDTIKQKRGEKTTDVEGLKLDSDYNRSVFGTRKK